MTLALIFLNVVVYAVYFLGAEPKVHIESLVTERSLQMAGRIFLALTKDYERPSWARSEPQNGNGPDEDRLRVLPEPRRLALLGAVALRNEYFLLKVSRLPSASFNPVEFGEFQKEIRALIEDDNKDPSYNFGLSQRATTPYAWLTYQFSHADFFHLLSNIVFLWLIGAILETALGAEILVSCYLLGGIAGGFLYLFMQDHGSAPMIGASGSISSLIGFFAMYFGKRRWSFGYFLAPVRDYFGVIYLPALVVIPLYIVSDFANLLSAPEALASGIAHAAHIGGALLGGLFGVLIKFIHRHFQKEIPATPSNSNFEL